MSAVVSPTFWVPTLASTTQVEPSGYAASSGYQDALVRNLQVGDGTVAAPSIAFASETNLGIARSGNEVIAFCNNGGAGISFDFASQKAYFSDAAIGTISGRDTAAVGGTLTITAGSATSAGNGGDLSLKAGRPAGGGTEGVIYVVTGGSNRVIFGSTGGMNVQGTATGAVAVSGANTGTIIYDSTLQHFYISENGGAYAQISTGAGSSYWSRSGTVLSPTTAGDTVRVGDGTASAPAYSYTSETTTGSYRWGTGAQLVVYNRAAGGGGLYVSNTDTNPTGATSIGLFNRFSGANPVGGIYLYSLPNAYADSGVYIKNRGYVVTDGNLSGGLVLGTVGGTPGTQDLCLAVVDTICTRLTNPGAVPSYVHGSDVVIGWSSTAAGTSLTSASNDTQLKRDAAGVIGAYASGGNYGTLRTGSLGMGGAITPGSTGQIQWMTGLGAITHVLGPTDQAFKLTAGSPSTATSAGNNVTITAGSGGATSGTGGQINMTGGAAGAASENGGWIVLTGGAGGGSGASTAGQVALQGGSGGLFGGRIIIASGNPTAATNGAAGNVQIYCGNSDGTAGGSTLSLAAGAAGATSGTGGNATITGGAARGGNSLGGEVDVTGGVGFGSGQGGPLVFTAGRGGATGTGGDATLSAGAGGATSGTGGALLLKGGAGGPTSNGGSVTINSGAGGSTSGNSGSITIQPGTNTSGTGGSISLTGRSATSGLGTVISITGGASSGSNSGGYILQTAGVGGATGNGGGFSLAAGAGGATSGDGGAFTASAGSATTSGVGGLTTINGGSGIGTDKASGGVTISTGDSTGTGGGKITFKAPTPAGGTGSGVNTAASVMEINYLGVSSYRNVTTAGWGVPAIYANGRSTAQTAAVANVASYTVGASDGSFEIQCLLNVTSISSASFTATVAYTDEDNASQTATLTWQQNDGTTHSTITNGTGTGPYYSRVLRIRCKASTTITVATTGTFTTVTYNVEAGIKQVA